MTIKLIVIVPILFNFLAGICCYSKRIVWANYRSFGCIVSCTDSWMYWCFNHLLLFQALVSVPCVPFYWYLMYNNLVLITKTLHIFVIVFYRMFSDLESNSIKNDILIKKAVIDDLSTTENPLWIEQWVTIVLKIIIQQHIFNIINLLKIQLDAL